MSPRGKERPRRLGTKKPSSFPRLGHALLLVSLATLLLAVRTPQLQEAAFQARVLAAERDVATALAAVQRFRQANGRLPSTSGAGMLSGELATVTPSGFDGSGEGYRLGWTRLEQVVEASDTVGAVSTRPAAGIVDADAAPTRPHPVIGELGLITVESADEALLATLLSRNGAARSFVRDSIWSLAVVPGDGT